MPSVDHSSAPTRLSILESARQGSENAWNQLTELYRPLIEHWAKQHGVSPQDAEDLSQDVLLTMVRSLHSFQHGGRIGSFRCWLRTMTCNRARDLWRLRQRNIVESVGSQGSWLDQLADENSELRLRWDRQHDEYILKSLLKLMELEFEPTTIRIFKRFALEACDANTLAEEFGTTVGAIYTARSRILQRIRKVARGLLDTTENEKSL